MANKPKTAGFRYFDLVTAATVVLILSGALLGTTKGVVVALLGVICVGFIALRERVYDSTVPWLTVSFSALYAMAIVVSLWSAPLMWFAMTVSVFVTISAPSTDGTGIVAM